MARKNIRIGPTIQFNTNDAVSTLVFLNTLPIFSYFTFASGGYIIRIRPIANGIFVVPLENELINPDEDGIKTPVATPIAIARKIHRVRYRSRKLSFFRSTTGKQLLAGIIIYYKGLRFVQ